MLSREEKQQYGEILRQQVCTAPPRLRKKKLRRDKRGWEDRNQRLLPPSQPRRTCRSRCPASTCSRNQWSGPSQSPSIRRKSCSDSGRVRTITRSGGQAAEHPTQPTITPRPTLLPVSTTRSRPATAPDRPQRAFPGRNGHSGAASPAVLPSTNTVVFVTAATTSGPSTHQRHTQLAAEVSGGPEQVQSGGVASTATSVSIPSPTAHPGLPCLQQLWQLPPQPVADPSNRPTRTDCESGERGDAGDVSEGRAEPAAVGKRHCKRAFSQVGHM